MGSWEFEGPLGPERWTGAPGRFERVTLNGRAISLDPADGELAALRPRRSACGHPGPFPLAFEHCPACGAALDPPEAVPDAERWSTPFGDATGLPPGGGKRPVADSRAEMAVPGPARLDWFVAGTPALLLCLDHTTGRLFRWVEGAAEVFAGGSWREVARLPPAGLPRWSWGVAATAEGAAVPGATGPVWVWPGPGAVRTASAKGVRRCLGGAVALGGAVLVPVATDAGLGVAWWNGSEWAVAPAGVPVPDGDGLFAAPVTAATEAFWAGGTGLLTVRMTEGIPEPVFSAWPEGWRPLRGVRPVLARDGVFHQIGRRDGAQSFRALRPGESGVRPFDRYPVSLGVASFMGSALHQEPWDPRLKEYRGDGSGFLLPLLLLGPGLVLAAWCSPRTGLLGFIGGSGDENGGEETLTCRLVLAGESVLPAELEMVVSARSATDLVALVFRGWLLVYDVPRNRCLRWRLADA